MMKRIKKFYSLLGGTLLFMNAAYAQLPQEIQNSNEWKLQWNDEFDYPDEQLDEKWISQNGPSGGVVLSSRWRENAVVNNGILELQAKKESRGDQDWTAASIWTKDKFGYGYYECRYKYAGATGTNNSFWTWTTYNVEEGKKAIELDVNEGHYPNIVNTNIHNWTDKYEDGSHDDWQEHHAMGGVEPQASYTHEFSTPIIATKIRFSSSNGSHFHIGEFRVYKPNSNGYPQDALANNADSSVEGLENLCTLSSTSISASGQYNINGRNTDPENIANGINKGANASWISQANGEKWLEISFEQAQSIGCVQFTNGWFGSGTWNSLISNYKLEYFNGTEWVEFAKFDISNGEDFAEEYHTYGMLWTEDVIKFYFDGELIRTFDHDFVHAETRIYLSLAVLDGGIAGAVTDAIDGTSMKVDYVRYYKYEEDPQTSIIGKDKNQIQVFPNPAKDFISLPSNNKYEKAEIYNTNGSLVMTSNNIQNSTLSISKLTPGVYHLLLKSNETQSRCKFIKQ